MSTSRGPRGSRKKAESTTANANLLDAMFDAVPAFIWVKDRQNRILRVSQLAAEVLGMPRQAIEGRLTAEFYPDEADRYFEDDLEVIDSGQAKLGILEPLATADGKRWVRTDKLPYRDAGGAIIGVIVFAVDITERIQTEQSLQAARDDLEIRVAERTAALADAVSDLRAEVAERRRAEERLREQQIQLVHLQRMRTVESLAAQLAHEINQPLAAIVNFARGLALRVQDGSVDPAGLSKASREISAQALRAAEVVRRLRDFVRRGDSARVRCGVAPIVQGALDMLQGEVRRREIAVHVHVAADAPDVNADATQIEQVVVNLLINALEACEADGVSPEIHIAVAARDDGAVEVRVVNGGAAIPVEDLSRVFEPFYSTKPDGLGLGLPISKSIVTTHGGTMWVESSPDDGTAFVFTIPTAS